MSRRLRGGCCGSGRAADEVLLDRLAQQARYARIDPRPKKAAESVSSKLGPSTAEAIRPFLRQVELRRGLPFPVLVPYDETIAA